MLLPIGTIACEARWRLEVDENKEPERPSDSCLLLHFNFSVCYNRLGLLYWAG